jgi:hypothetical protein
LGRSPSAGLEILGLIMTVQAPISPVSRVCQKNDEHKTGHRSGIKLPASWKLTKQQQAFIDLFAEEDHKNNNS